MANQSPSTKNYTLGKGRLYFTRKYSDGTTTGSRDLGNCSALSYSADVESLEHFSSRGGIGVKDANIITQITPSVTFTLDEVTADNLTILSLATKATISQPAGTATLVSPTAYTGTWVFVGSRNISNVVIKDSGDTSTYVEGTDYRISAADNDAAIGRVYIIPGGGITDGDVINITYDNAVASTVEVQAFTESEVRGEIFFMSDNPVGGQRELYLWDVSLTPSGDTAFIGEDLMVMEFAGEILDATEEHPDSPYFSIIEVE